MEEINYNFSHGIKSENNFEQNNLPSMQDNFYTQQFTQRKKYERRKEASGFDITKLIQKRERPKVNEKSGIARIMRF